LYAQQEEAKPPKQEEKTKPEKQQQNKGKQQQDQSKQQQQHAQKQQQDQSKQQQQRVQKQQQDQSKQQRQRQQQIHQPSQQRQRVAPAQRREVWQQHRATNWQSEHRDWQRRGGYNGYRIPDAVDAEPMILSKVAAGLVGSDVDNLKDAIKGESYEIDSTYLEFAGQARASGDTAAAARFEEIRHDEMGHRDAFKNALAKARNQASGGRVVTN